MALRLGKRKEPRREDKQLKHALKITSKVLDDQTLRTIAQLMHAKAFKSLDFPVAQGKEAVVFRATRHDAGFVAVKVFKFETSAFRTIINYIEGDPRFDLGSLRHSKRAIVKTWARKEFANLKACFEAGVTVPRPLALKENIIVMEFIGFEGKPCISLTEAAIHDPEKVFAQLMDEMRKMYRAGIVHADFSPYNIMLMQKPIFFESEVLDEKAFVIDLAQGVSIQHPRAREFLERDVETMSKFFSKLEVKSELLDSRKALAFITAPKPAAARGAGGAGKSV